MYVHICSLSCIYSRLVIAIEYIRHLLILCIFVSEFLINSMKMHSYTMTNYKMKREWIDAGKPKGD